MSRLLGFLRDILIASFVGTGVVADAFFTAFRFPNMFRRIFGEGAFNSAFVPLFGKKVQTDGRNAAVQFANNAFTILFAVLGVLTVLAIPLMGVIMLAVVPGFLPGFEETLTEEKRNFRIALRGTETVHFVGERAQFHDLRLVERGNPSAFKVVAEVFGGEVQAVGSAVAVTADEPWALDQEGTWQLDLPESHSFTVLEGTVSGEGLLKIYNNDPSAINLTVKLSKITFVYLMCMALVAHLSGVLTTLRRFAAPAFAPVLLNIIFLIGLVGVIRFTDAKGEVLAWCVAVAGFVQLGVLFWTCRRAGLPVGLATPEFNPEIKRLLFLMGPGILAAGIQQINLLIGGIIASFQQGAISFLYYSDRVYQLPLGMIGIAFGMVLLPEITRHLSAGKREDATATMVSGLEMAMIVTVPAAIALMTIPGEIISVLFERGDFDARDSLETGKALAAFAVGLPGYVLIKVLQPGYFAQEDTKSPMLMAGVTVLVNIVVSLILFPTFGHVGIAFATSVAAWVNVWLLWRGLKDLIHLERENLKRLMGMVLASVAMALVLLLAKGLLSGWIEGGFWQRGIALALLVGIGITVYAIAVLRLGVTSLAKLKAAFRG